VRYSVHEPNLTGACYGLPLAIQLPETNLAKKPWIRSVKRPFHPSFLPARQSIRGNDLAFEDYEALQETPIFCVHRRCPPDCSSVPNGAGRDRKGTPGMKLIFSEHAWEDYVTAANRTKKYLTNQQMIKGNQA